MSHSGARRTGLVCTCWGARQGEMVMGLNGSDCGKMIRRSDCQYFKDRHLFEKKQAQPRWMSLLSRKKWNTKDSSGFDVKKLVSFKSLQNKVSRKYPAKFPSWQTIESPPSFYNRIKLFSNRHKSSNKFLNESGKNVRAISHLFIKRHENY